MSHFHHILKGVISQRSGVDADLAVYLGSLTTPLSAGQVTKLNTFVKDLKTGLGITSLSDAFDVMYIHANETSESGLKNLVKRAHDAETVNTVAFSALEGFTGDDTNSYIRTNWIGSTQASAYELNSASFAIYFNTTTDRAGFELSGVWDSSGNARRIQINRPNGHLDAYGLALNCSGATVSSTEKLGGLYVASRDGASSQKLYVNKDVKVTGTQTALSIPDQEVLILALRTSAGGTTYFENDQVSFAFLGKGLSQAEVDVITDAYETYKASL